jgi:hypothetical protein
LCKNDSFEQDAALPLEDEPLAPKPERVGGGSGTETPIREGHPNVFLDNHCCMYYRCGPSTLGTSASAGLDSQNGLLFAS